MTTGDFISALFYRVDEAMKNIPKHPLASLWPSEIVTLGVLFALKGVGNRAFYRWLHRAGIPCFPRCLSGHACFASWPPTGRGGTSFWRGRRSWASLIATALNCSTPCAKGAVPDTLAAKGSPLSAGVSGGNSVSS